MGLDPTTIASAASIGSNLINYYATSSMNEATRKWNEAQYRTQRWDALQDWHRQNEYNHPIEQMRRLREAGLNPHLVYGGGANSVSGPVRSTDTKSWNPSVPKLDLQNVVSEIMGVSQQQQALKNAEAQLMLLNAQKDRTDADTLRILEDTEGKNIFNKYAADEIVSRINNRNKDTELKDVMIGYTLNKDQREQLRLTNDIQKTAQDILESQQRVRKSQAEVNNIIETKEVIKQTGILKKLQATHKAMGLDDDYTQAEWFLANAVYDPKGAVDILNKYLEAIGHIAEKGVEQTGKTMANTAKSIWQALTRKF